MTFETSDFEALGLTLRLASWTTALLLLSGAPLAYWLAGRPSRLKSCIAALTALPLVVPPTVLGFYLLVFLGPRGPLGSVLQAVGAPPLVFSFPGLVLASLVASLPFVVQPLAASFRMIGTLPFEAAATLGLGPLRRFFWIAVPLARSGFLGAAVLGFTHTVGEFGVVLMLGGSLPGETRVLSIALYEHVEAIRYERAHALALTLVVGSFLALLALPLLRQPKGRRST